MDPLEQWHAYVADLHSLFSHWEERRRRGVKLSSRDREIFSICIFALCLEQNESKRFLIGFPQRGTQNPGLMVSDLFQRGFRDLEDWDVLLIPDLGESGPIEREIHQCQMVSYLFRAGNTADIISFLEEKKLRRSPPNNDLRLILTLEQATEYDWVKLSMHLQQRRPRCPFNQVFLVAHQFELSEPYWRCMQLFPRAATLRHLFMAETKALLFDRPTKLGPQETMRNLILDWPEHK